MLGVGIAMQRVVGQPGELLVRDLVLEHIAHGFNRQPVEELLLETISAVRAKDLDHVVAHERIGYEAWVARPQARATRNVERGGNHHAQEDIGVGTSQILAIGFTQIAQNTEGLNVVGRKRRRVPPICMDLAAQDVMTQRGKIAHQPIDELGIGRILLAKLAELLLTRAVDELSLQKQTLCGLIQRALGGTGRKIVRTTELADLSIQTRKRLNRARRRRVGSDGRRRHGDRHRCRDDTGSHGGRPDRTRRRAGRIHITGSCEMGLAGALVDHGHGALLLCCVYSTRPFYPSALMGNMFFAPRNRLPRISPRDRSITGALFTCDTRGADPSS